MSLSFILHGWVPSGQTSYDGERGTGPSPRRTRHQSGWTKQQTTPQKVLSYTYCFLHRDTVDVLCFSRPNITIRLCVCACACSCLWETCFSLRNFVRSSFCAYCSKISCQCTLAWTEFHLIFWELSEAHYGNECSSEFLNFLFCF